MANEAIRKYGTPVTLSTSLGSIANNQLSSAAGTTYSATNTSDYPDAIFTVDVGTIGGTPTSGTTLDIYIRPLDIDSTTDAPAPPTGASTAAYKAMYAATITLHAATTGVYLSTIARDIPRSGEVYIFNNGSGQTVGSSGSVVVKMTPCTIGPA